ncbi:MAG: DEAD/DEAH box helicase, partial [Deltaproteobacteria bacterium]|nr:DEAD/DEAH box helicase [Deltaproteobacteria bacterium]
MRRTSFVEKARRRFLAGMGVPHAAEFVEDEFQSTAIATVLNGEDTLVVAPTGAGKTYIALRAIEAMLQLHCKSVYTTPLKALSNTKYTDLKRRFEPAHTVGLLTGDRKIDTDADVVVATTEIYRNELYRSYGRFALVVLDEVHFISDSQRGPVWEESIIFTPKDSTLLMLS